MNLHLEQWTRGGYEIWIRRNVPDYEFYGMDILNDKGPIIITPLRILSLFNWSLVMTYKLINFSELIKLDNDIIINKNIQWKTLYQYFQKV